MKKSMKKPAQQLIEFLLVMPFIVIILGILTEYAYALNINLTLNQGLKSAVSDIYSTIKPGSNENFIRDKVKENLIKYLAENNAPTNSENNISISYAIIGEAAIFTASYTYIPAFTLPNVYFKILPDKFNFFTASAVPKAFIGANNYAGISSLQLDGIWSASNFTDINAYNGSKKGIMKENDLNNGRGKMLFLIPVTISGLIKPYVLVNWNGQIISTTNLTYNTYIFDSNNGKLHECRADGLGCSGAGKTFFEYLKNNNVYNIIFVHDDMYLNIPSTPDMLSADLSNYWVNPSGATDLSADNVHGVLKRTLALADSSGLSRGNYDKSDISAYNPDILSSYNPYQIEYFGSMVFVTSGDNINNIIGGQIPPNRQGN